MTTTTSHMRELVKIKPTKSRTKNIRLLTP